VSGCKTTAAMWSTLQGVFQRKSVMNKMKARREFYTVAMKVGEGMLGYINRVRNLGENLKAMGDHHPSANCQWSRRRASQSNSRGTDMPRTTSHVTGVE